MTQQSMENQNDDKVKAALPIICPHCEQALVVEISLGADLMTPEATEEIMKNVKDDSIKTITTP